MAQSVNNQIFSSTNTADGVWQDVSNMVSLSVHIVNMEATTTIEISNDPLVNSDGSAIAVPAPPTLTSVPMQNNPAGNPYFPAMGAVDVLLTFITNYGNGVTKTAGETTAGSTSSATVTSGNSILVTPSVDSSGFVAAYNVYARVSGSGAPFVKQTENPVVIKTPFLLKILKGNGPAPPSSSTANAPAVGVSVGTLAAGTSTGVTIYGDANNGSQILWAPSSQLFKWLRVRKSNAGGTKATTAYLIGMNG